MFKRIPSLLAEGVGRGVCQIPSSDEEGNEIACYEIEDMYGEHIKYGNIKELINQLKEVIKKDDYWRFKILLSMLEMFKDVPDVYVVHYGY